MNKEAVKVVIFKVNALGDSVVFVSAVQALRSRCPDWMITLLTTPNEAELYRGALGPQEIIIHTKQAFNKAFRYPWTLAARVWEIRKRAPDACLIAFDQGNVAHLAAKMSGADIRIGGNVGTIRIARSLTQEIPTPREGIPVLWNWNMARLLAQSLGRGDGWPDTPPPPNLSHLVPKGPRPSTSRRRVVVHSGSKRILNQWPHERFAALAKSLARDFDVLWVRHDSTTGPAPAGAIESNIDSVSRLAELFAGADLLICNNSGPMHLANALGCPGVVISGPSAKGWDPYWFSDRWTVLRHPDLYCVPCGIPTAQVPGCANFETPMACLNYWTEEKVEAACRSQLERVASKKP